MTAQNNESGEFIRRRTAVRTIVVSWKSFSSVIVLTISSEASKHPSLQGSILRDGILERLSTVTIRI
jgi:hypothetical protein